MAVTPDKPAIVYQAVNIVDGKRYVGVTCRTLRQRKWEHAYDSRTTRSRSCRFHNAIRKHGFEKFRFFVVETATSFAEACEIERRLIYETAPEYNVTRGGEGFLGRIVSQEERGKMSARARANPAKITMPGWKHTEEARARMRQSMAARAPKSYEHMKIMWTKGNAGRRKAVVCLTDGKRFQSATAAAINYGWEPTVVANAIGKQGGKTRGLMFQYETL